MNPKIFCIVVCLLLLIVSCGRRNAQGVEGTPELATDTLSYEARTISQDSGDCDSTSYNCASIRFEYPEFTAADQAVIIDTLETFIQKRLCKNVYGDSLLFSPEEVVQSYIQDYRDFTESGPEYATGWSVIRKIAVLQNSPRTLSLSSLEYSFLGGAHGNTTTKLINYNRRTAQRIGLDELFIRDYQQQLTAIAGKLFRIQFKIETDSLLSGSGYWFENDQFTLNSNFSIQNDGLHFVYNPYEIAPYVYGTIELLLPYHELQPILKSRFRP